MADLTKIRNLKADQLNEIAVGEIVLNVDAMTYVTKNSEGNVVPYIELLNILLPEGTPINAAASTATLTAVNPPAATELVNIGGMEYVFVEGLTEGELSATYIEVLIEVSASDTLDNLISAINQATAPTKYKNGDQIPKNFIVTATAGEEDTVLITANTKGVSGNLIAVSTTEENFSFGEDVETLEGGVDGTLGSKGDMYKDDNYIYIAIDDNTITDTNWRRIALGTAY